MTDSADHNANHPAKETMRYEALRHRDRIHAFNNEDPDAVCDLFFEVVAPEKDQVVSLYWPMEKEFDCSAIMERLLAENIICALPVIIKNSKELRFAAWKEGEPLESGPLNLQQPAVNEQTRWVDPDIVIVPFLAFDRKGHRLGYGGGYYDATLTALRNKKKITAVGVGYAQQAVIFNLPVEPHDEKMDIVITPQRVHRF